MTHIPESEKIRIIDTMLKSPRSPIRPEAVRSLTNEQKIALFDKLVVDGAILADEAGRYEEKEKKAALREKLIPIVRQAILRYEEQAEIARKAGWYYSGRSERHILYDATHCALALRDKESARRLLPKLQYDDSVPTQMLKILLGGEAKAKELIKSIEANNSQDFFKYWLAACLSVEIPDRTITKRLMRELEKRGRIDYIAKIALKIDDKETILKCMQNSADRCIDRGDLVDLAPYQPELAKKLIKHLESQGDNNLVYVGEIAAVLGDIATTKRVINKLNDKRDYSGVTGIAAILGDVSIAEEMMWEHKKQNENRFSESLNYLFRSAQRHNPEAAYHLMNVLEKKGYDVGLIAAGILQNL